MTFPAENVPSVPVIINEKTFRLSPVYLTFITNTV